MTRRYTKEETKAIVAMRLSGVTPAAIGAKFGRSAQSVQRMVRHHVAREEREAAGVVDLSSGKGYSQNPKPKIVLRGAFSAERIVEYVKYFGAERLVVLP